jgi:holliday junction DNA helicase RuvB
VAGTCRGTPRTSINRLRWIHDYAVVKRLNKITEDKIAECLKLAGVEPDGTEADDRKYLQKLKILQPAGINTMTSALNIDRETIEKVIEPFLIQKGLIKKTTKGRILNEGSYK